jgi:uncharacterized protein YebE (UPF0316 family)
MPHGRRRVRAREEEHDAHGFTLQDRKGTRCVEVCISSYGEVLDNRAQAPIQRPLRCSRLRQDHERGTAVMSWDVLVGCTMILIARIGDVSFGSLRTVAVVSGHRGLAWLFGFLEVIIWVFAVSAVIAHIDSEPVYGIAFALGAASGSYVGVTLMRWLPIGDQVVRVFTRNGTALFDDLRRKDFGVTQFQGIGRDGPVTMLFVQVRRNRTPLVVRTVRELDPSCYYTIDDIRVASVAASTVLPAITPP